MGRPDALLAIDLALMYEINLFFHPEKNLLCIVLFFRCSRLCFWPA